MDKQIVIRVEAEQLAEANEMARQLGDSPEGVDSFAMHNAFNASGSSADPIEAYVLDVWASAAWYELVSQAIAGMAGVTLATSYAEAVGDLQPIDWLVEGA